MKLANLKKSIVIVLALVMSLTAVALAAENPFTDVANDAYYHDGVMWALENGVTTGVTETQFQPDATCTRGQVATFLWRAKGKPEPTIANPFTDVAESSPFYKAILWAAETGITSGTTATTFNPNGTCSSAHVVTFLWRANGKPAAEGESALAAGYAADAYYKDAVAWADTKGLLANNAAFDPNAKAPRADIVTYLYLDNAPAEEPTEAPVDDHTLDIAKGTFSGYDLGLNASGQFLCVRFEKPEGANWDIEGSYPTSYCVTVYDPDGMEIWKNEQFGSRLGLNKTGGDLHQVGKNALSNGYTVANVKGMTGVTVEVTVVDKDGVTWTGKAEDLKIYDDKPLEGVEIDTELTITPDAFGGYDVGFNSTGQYLCVRFGKPAGTSWNEKAPESYTVVIKDAQGKDIMNETTKGVAIGLGNSGTYQVGKGEKSLKNGYDFSSVRGLEDVTVTVTVVDANGVTWTGTRTGLTTQK